jgi:N-acetylmuramoyl-L-alanine amidase CwlA
MMIVVPPTIKHRTRAADPANYSKMRREPRLIVIHSTEGREGDGATDDNVAAGIAKPKPAGQRTSFHDVVDGDSVTHCVPYLLTAWHAGHTANLIGIGVELCGRADQTRDQWLDETSGRTLGIAARLVGELCREFKIPVVYLDAPTLNASNPRGITMHRDVSNAWHESTHTDPGPHFPIVEFMDAVRGVR